MEMKRYHLNEVIDFLVAVAAGLLIGYYRQRMADSGDSPLDKLLMSMFLASAGFAIGFWVVKGLNLYSRTRYAWILVGVIGAVVCSLNLNVVYYAIHNLRYRGSRSLIEYGAWILPNITQSFLIMIIFYSIFAIVIIGSVRVLVPRR